MSRTDGQTDRWMTYCGTAVLCIALHGKNTIHMALLKCAQIKW